MLEVIPCWTVPRNGKIKSKRDCEEFITKCLLTNGGWYYLGIDEREKNDLWFYKESETNVCLMSKPIYTRGDIFFPSLVEINFEQERDKMIDFCWRNRKAINKRFFTGN